MKKILSVLVVLATLVGAAFANDRFINIKDYTAESIVENDDDYGIAYDIENRTEIYYSKCNRFTGVCLEDDEEDNVTYVFVSKDTEMFSDNIKGIINFMIDNNITCAMYELGGYDCRAYILNDVFIYCEMKEE